MSSRINRRTGRPADNLHHQLARSRGRAATRRWVAAALAVAAATMLAVLAFGDLIGGAS